MENHESVENLDELFAIHELEPRLAASPDAWRHGSGGGGGSGHVHGGSGHIHHGSGGSGAVRPVVVVTGGSGT